MSHSEEADKLFGELRYRPAEPTDTAFLVSSWAKSARLGERHVFMSNEDYFTFYRHKIIRLLTKSQVVIQYREKTPDAIVGFAVYDFDNDNHLILHYVYISKAFWNERYGTRLIAHIYPDFETKPIATTSLCLFQVGRDVSKGKGVKKYKPGLTDKYPLLTYNPYFEEAK